MRVAACVAATLCCASASATASASSAIPNDLVVRQMKRAMRAAKTSSGAPADAARGRALAGSTTYCDLLNKVGTCAFKTSSATCDADASCAWVAADSECGLSDAEATNAAAMVLAPTFGVAFQQVACALETAPTCPSVECEHFASANACVVTEAEATTLSGGDAFLGKLFYRAMKCSQFDAQSTCNADSECAWEYDSDDAEYTCNPSDLGTLAIAECPALSPEIQTFLNANPQAAGLGGGSSSTPPPPPAASTPSSAERTTAVAASLAAAMAAAALA